MCRNSKELIRIRTLFPFLIRPCQCGAARPTKWDAEAAKWDLKAGEKNWPKRWSEQQNTFVAKGACCIECEGGPTHSRTKSLLN